MTGFIREHTSSSKRSETARGKRLSLWQFPSFFSALLCSSLISWISSPYPAAHFALYTLRLRLCIRHTLLFSLVGPSFTIANATRHITTYNKAAI